MAHTPDRDLSARRHRARQLRARIVEVAQELRAAYEQHEVAYEILMRPDTPLSLMEQQTEQRLWEALEQRREALFALLGELEMLEGSGRA